MEISNSTMYQFRINEQEKAETFKILQGMGIKPSQAVRLFFQQIRKTHAMPFPIEYTPNASTAKVLLKDDTKKNYKRAKSVDDLFADLHK